MTIWKAGYWFLLIDVDWCWVVLVYIDYLEDSVLIYVGLCWLVFIYVDYLKTGYWTHWFIMILLIYVDYLEGKALTYVGLKLFMLKNLKVEELAWGSLRFKVSLHTAAWCALKHTQGGIWVSNSASDNALVCIGAHRGTPWEAHVAPHDSLVCTETHPGVHMGVQIWRR